MNAGTLFRSIAAIALAAAAAAPSPAAARTTKTSAPIVLKATVLASGCLISNIANPTSTVYQRGQSVTVTPLYPSFTVSGGVVTPNPIVTFVRFHCAPGVTVTATLATTNAQALNTSTTKATLDTTDSFIASTTTQTQPSLPACASFPRTASGSAPATGNATPDVYLWYGACGNVKNNSQPGTYAVSDALTVTFS